MRRSWLVPVMVVTALCGMAQAAPPATSPAPVKTPSAAQTAASAAAAAANPGSALEARLNALERRVAELEKQLAAEKAATAAAAAAAAAAPPVRPTAPDAPATAPAAAPAAPVVELWKEAGTWSKLRRGMTWSQVRHILGSPGSKTTGVFGDVWFYPDSSGGRVVFDRDSRVSEWTEPGAAR